ncbi:VaFE repeat-containing surface-anchored protein [Corynebacterium breve]|uniref:VaFE repeat-containing surface-anchored protein n=1 Tax=Corynebacterium breve TaxID=3049799 RepID=A0ABY8VEP8_9CORY|nr:VaFE repeat-containing surface-anchored protein [Corynebacterium breve]WIM67431.1 VaFE repeat-containing surface-anchored protein [Corynebacterium breve]
MIMAVILATVAMPSAAHAVQVEGTYIGVDDAGAWGKHPWSTQGGNFQIPLTVHNERGASADAQVAYCFNASKYYPSKSSVESGLRYTKHYGESLTGYADTPAGGDIDQAILDVIYNGYPKNASGLQGKLGLTDEEFRYATQAAVWYYTDSKGSYSFLSQRMNSKIVEAYVTLTRQSGARHELIGVDLSNATLNIYEPSNYYNATNFQNLITAEFVNPDSGETITEVPTTQVTTTLPAITETEVTTAPAVTETVTETPTTTVTDTEVIETRVTETTTSTLPAETETVVTTAPVVTVTETSEVTPVTETTIIDGGTVTESTTLPEVTETTEVDGGTTVVTTTREPVVETTEVDGGTTVVTTTREPVVETTEVDGGTTVVTTTREPVIETEWENPTTTVTETAETVTVTETPGIVTETVTPEPVTTTVTTAPEQVTEVVPAPWIGTNAHDKDGGKDDKVLDADGGTVVDTVIYVGLTPGKEYTMKGELVDKDAEGASTGITAEKTFTPEKAEGSVKLEFKVPAEHEGKTLVVFEELSLDGEVVAEHKNLDSVNQTIVVGENTPLIKTNAKDKADNDRFMDAEGGTVVDTVDYVGLKSGDSYTMKGELMDVQTGEGTGITADKEFTADKSKGSVDLEFTVPAGYEGKTLVVFERLYDANGELVAEHVDREDIKQTVLVKKTGTCEDKGDESEDCVPAPTCDTDGSSDGSSNCGVIGSSVSPWWLLVPVALLGLIGVGGLGSSDGGSSDGGSSDGGSSDGNAPAPAPAPEAGNGGEGNGGVGNGTVPSGDTTPEENAQPGNGATPGENTKPGTTQSDAIEGAGGGLANTGANVWMVGIAAMLMIAAGGALMIRRRKEA